LALQAPWLTTPRAVLLLGGHAAEIGRAIGCALLLDDAPRSDVSLQRELALQDIVFC
jgi:hypothetical protein